MRKRIFLLYVVMDISASMTETVNGQEKIQTAMDIVPGIIESTKRNSTVAAALRVSVIGFNQSVSELFEANKNIRDRHVYALESWWKNNRDNLSSMCAGQTYFTKLFNELNQIIKQDQAEFNPEDYELYRPVVYFLTDARPEGKSETAEAIVKEYDKLVSAEGDLKAPAILAIGIGDAERKDIEKFAAGRVIKIWKYDEEKNKDMPDFPNGEYRKANKDMAFVFKGENAARNLNTLNRGVVRSVINSIQQIEPTTGDISGPITVLEPVFNPLFGEIKIDEDEMING